MLSTVLKGGGARRREGSWWWSYFVWLCDFYYETFRVEFYLVPCYRFLSVRFSIIDIIEPSHEEICLRGLRPW